MSLLEPDDFEGEPYVRGLNQKGHTDLGAAIVGLLVTLGLGVPLAAAITALGVFLWEYEQLRMRGATLADYRADLKYWYLGIFLWSIALLVWPQIPPWILSITFLVFIKEYMRDD